MNYKPVEDFNIDAASVSINDDKKTCVISFDLDGWDNQKKAYQEIEMFADGDNDIIGEDIEIKLNEMGLSLDFPGQLHDDGDMIVFELEILE